MLYHCSASNYPALSCKRSTVTRQYSKTARGQHEDSLGHYSDSNRALPGQCYGSTRAAPKVPSRPHGLREPVGLVLRSELPFHSRPSLDSLSRACVKPSPGRAQPTAGLSPQLGTICGLRDPFAIAMQSRCGRLCLSCKCACISCSIGVEERPSVCSRRSMGKVSPYGWAFNLDVRAYSSTWLKPVVGCRIRSVCLWPARGRTEARKLALIGLLRFDHLSVFWLRCWLESRCFGGSRHFGRNAKMGIPTRYSVSGPSLQSRLRGRSRSWTR